MRPTAQLLALLSAVTAVMIVVSAPPCRAEVSVERPCPQEVRVHLPDCELPFDRELLLERLDVELRDRGSRLQRERSPSRIAPPDETVALVIFDFSLCDSSTSEAHLFVHNGAAGTAHAGVLRLEAVDEPARLRIFAVALAEHIIASWQTLAPTPPASRPVPADDTDGAPPASAVPAELVRQLEARVDERVAAELARQAVASTPAPLPAPTRPLISPLLDAALVGRSLPAGGGGLIGGRLRATIPLRRAPLAFALDGGGFYGAVDDPLGRIDLTGLLTGLSFSITSFHERLSAMLGPRLELGWIRARGTPLDEDTIGYSIDRFVSMVSLDGSCLVALTRRLALLFFGSVGYVIYGIEAWSDDRQTIGLFGVVLELGIGLSVALFRENS